MKNLVIDIGNSRIKSALFAGDELLEETVYADLDQAIASWAALSFQKCMVSSVRFERAELEPKFPFPVEFFSPQTTIPLVNGYDTPASLGLDRLAAAVGAWHLASGKATLVIDLGTCVTYDLVDAQGVYRGGAISPGLQMRAKAMHAFTASLPAIELSPIPKTLQGTSTDSCLKIGVWSGLKFELAGFIEAYRVNFPEISIYLCGGDAESFDSLAKDHIFVVPNLVLIGLNCILNHHVA